MRISANVHKYTQTDPLAKELYHRGRKDVFVLATEIARGLRKFAPFMEFSGRGSFVARSDQRFLDVATLDLDELKRFLEEHMRGLGCRFKLEMSARSGVVEKEMATQVGMDAAFFV